MNLERCDAEPLQMSLPRRAIGEDAIGMLAQAGDDGAGERAGAHVGQSLVIDDVIAMPGAQQFEEVEAAFRTGGPEPGELRVADLGAEAVLGFVARPGVVGGDPRRVGQAGPQHGAGFVEEALLAGDQQANHLPLGDRDAESSQQRDQSRRGDLSLMMLGEHEAAQFRSEMAIDACRQGRDHRLAVRGLPAFPAKIGDVRADHQILNQETGIALETRAGRRIGLKRPLLINDHRRARAAASPPLARRAGRFRLARLFHPARLDARLDVRPTGPALQPSDFVTQRRNQSPKFRPLLQQLQRQALELGRRKRVDVRRRHSSIESEKRRFENPLQPP